MDICVFITKKKKCARPQPTSKKKNMHTRFNVVTSRRLRLFCDSFVCVNYYFVIYKVCLCELLDGELNKCKTYLWWQVIREFFLFRLEHEFDYIHTNNTKMNVNNQGKVKFSYTKLLGYNYMQLTSLKFLIKWVKQKQIVSIELMKICDEIDGLLIQNNIEYYIFSFLLTKKERCLEIYIDVLQPIYRPKWFWD